MDNYAEIIPKALDAYMRNDRIGSHELFDVHKYQKANKGKFGKAWPDCSSLLKSSQAMLNLVEGLLSGSGETISACIEEFWAAEKLANECSDKECIENRISRGSCYLFGGLLQVFIRSYVKSGVNLTIGYKLIRDFETDVVSYSGGNKVLIRSMGLMILALLNFFSLILPPTVTSIGDMLGISVSKKKFHEYIDMCVAENGPYAVIARLIYVYYLINSKSLLFAKSDPKELKISRDHIDACLHQYPDSLAFRVMSASMFLSENNVEGAIKTLSDERIAPAMKKMEWATMALAVNYKLGVSYLCMLDVVGARKAFRDAGDSVENSNMSWNYIPFMRTLEGICYLASADKGFHEKALTLPVSEIRETALKIFADTYVDRPISSSAILPADLWGARSGYEYACMLNKASDDELRDYVQNGHALVDILFCMCTSLYSFERINPKCLSKELTRRLRELKSSKKAQSILGECYRRKGMWAEAVNALDDAIELTDAEIANGKPDKDSVLPFSLIFQAAALCEDGDVDTAKEVINDLDHTMSTIAANANNVFAAVFSKITGSIAPVTVDPHHPKPGNLVNDKGNEYELILNFRRNGAKRRIDDLAEHALIAKQ